MTNEANNSYMQLSREVFRQYKALADRALRQVPDDALTITLDAESNSIAIVMKHLAGNLLSRWTDFLTSDGEKPNRHRDGEFENTTTTRAEILAHWEAGWACALAALDSLTDADLNRTVMIRNEPHTVMQAIHRQIGHTAYHVGQIVFLCKHFSADHWTTLTVPRGKSEEFNKRMMSGKQ